MFSRARVKRKVKYTVKRMVSDSKNRPETLMDKRFTKQAHASSDTISCFIRHDFMRHPSRFRVSSDTISQFFCQNVGHPTRFRVSSDTIFLIIGPKIGHPSRNGLKSTFKTVKTVTYETRFSKTPCFIRHAHASYVTK